MNDARENTIQVPAQAILEALQKQRNDALNQVATLTAQLELLRKEITELKEKHVDE